MSTRVIVSALVVATGLVAACGDAGCPSGTVQDGEYCRKSSEIAGATGEQSGTSGETGLPGSGSTGTAPLTTGVGASGTSGVMTTLGGMTGSLTNGVLGTAGMGTMPQAGSGPAAATAGMPAMNAGAGVGVAGPPVPEPCATEGAIRCSAAGMNQREQCTGALWVATTACASAEVCKSDGTCGTIADLCRGSGGEPVCDAQGAMVPCNADGTAGAPQSCMSAAHCRAGLPNKTCAMCIPNEHRCTDRSLEVCSPDGMTFSKVQDCETAKLCNALVGACTAAACEPNKVACMGNTLTKCNADGTGFDMMQPCNSGTCDAAGGDCNMCQPGEKSCSGDTLQTCSADGQRFDQSRCPSNGHCTGVGNCVACTNDSHCPAASDDCKVSYCGSDSRCGTMNAADRTTCRTLLASGVCSSGTCVGCIDSTDCKNKLGTPVCDSLTRTCVECTATAGCNSDQTCSFGRCVSKCGNGVKDPGEECDPPNTQYCDSMCMEKVVITSCTFGCQKSDSCMYQKICTESCNTDADCTLRPPGARPVCATDRHYCAYSCGDIQGGTCPKGTTCITALSLCSL